jgi:predicted SprT family Zn-dependent metalloprotease
MTPTNATYAELQQAFDHFNARLFDGALPPCLITLQREKRTYGYFSHQRFVRGDNSGDYVDEIALNPAYFGIVPMIEICQTISHEMVHQWQSHFGKPGRRRYHNKEWAKKMESIGLMPSDTGQPGGAKTGEHMADYPIVGGPFETAFNELVTDDFRVSWHDRFPPPNVVQMAMAGHEFSTLAASANPGVRIQLPEATQPTRARFICPGCKSKLWGKPSLKVRCVPCDQEFAVG